MTKREQKRQAYQDELKRDREIRESKQSLRNVFNAISAVLFDRTASVDSFDWHLLVSRSRRAEQLDNQTVRLMALTSCCWQPLEWEPKF